MIYPRPTKKESRRLRFDAYHLGASDCLRFHELRSPWLTPGIEQLRYLLGWLAMHLSTDDCFPVPEQINWRYLRGNKVNGVYKPKPCPPR